MKSLSAIRTGFTEDLIVRAADVSLKERRKLLLVARETLFQIFIWIICYIYCEWGDNIPTCASILYKTKTIDDIVEQTCGRILDNFGINIDTFERWDGISHR